ncbi:MAG: hypothetical protein Q7S03_01005 [bacterium]|nr:hypothetical protein [bacterium]
MPDIQDSPSPASSGSTPAPDIKKDVIGSAFPSQPAKDSKPAPRTIKYPPLLLDKSQTILLDLEQKLGTKLLVYYTNHDSRITDEDVQFFFSHVRELPAESSLCLILISPGGSGTAAWRIANLLKNYCHNLTVIIPSQCASAATLLSLAADKILFGPAGYLTAIDTSLVHPLNPRFSERFEPTSISVDQVNRIKNFINEDLKNHPCSKSLSEILFEKIHPIVIGELERSSSLSKLIAINIMQLRNNVPSEEDQKRIADILNDSYPTHGYPIVLKEAQRIGLPAESTPSDLNTPLWDLTKLCSLISRKVVTNFSPDYYHLEGVPVMIESASKRTLFVASYDKRLGPRPGMGWLTENERSRWLVATPSENPAEKYKLSEIEL